MLYVSNLVSIALNNQTLQNRNAKTGRRHIPNTYEDKYLFVDGGCWRETLMKSCDTHTGSILRMDELESPALSNPCLMKGGSPWQSEVQ